ncbi:hypothetical protein [Roseomonas haemaphysalidis]|nr:hypothetical protein [Roseomonas haemaphysalidis]
MAKPPKPPATPAAAPEAAPKMTEGQRAYETKRAAKAGKTLDQWLKLKTKEREALLAASKAAPATPAKQGFFARLMEKATKPL